LTNLSWNEDPKKPLPDEVFEQKRKEAGMFIMISSKDLPKEEVLPHYHSHQTIEQIVDTAKNHAKLLPSECHNLETFNGHLLISFLSTIVYLRLQKIFNEENFSTIDFITELRGVMCTVHDDCLRIYKKTAKQNKILKILDIDIPLILPAVK
jgi:transposase